MVVIVQCFQKTVPHTILVPLAAVTNYHKLSGRNQYRLIILQFSEVHGGFHWGKITVSKGLRSFWMI